METEFLEKKEKSDSRNFADKWLNNIYEILMKIEDYERLAKNGCQDLLDYVQNSNLDLALIQEKNYQLFMTEVEILLNDIKHFVDKNEFLRLILKFNLIRKIEYDHEGFIDNRTNSVTRDYINILKPEFSIVHPLMSSLRGLLIKALFEFIKPTIKVKGEDRL